MSKQEQGEETVALVTGASHGIGLEVARQLAEHGMHVVVTARDEAKAQEAAQTLGADGLQVTPMALDVASGDSVHTLARQLQDDPGRLDVLVNNAAGLVDWSEKASSADLDASRALFEVNVFGTWRVAETLLPLLRQSAHGRLVNREAGAVVGGQLSGSQTRNTVRPG